MPAHFGQFQHGGFDPTGRATRFPKDMLHRFFLKS